MKQAKQVEIILVTSTSLFEKELLEKNNPGVSRIMSRKEKLIDACWNGLVRCMFPEIFAQERMQGLYLWKVSAGNSLLEMEMGGGHPAAINGCFSIDPYLVDESLRLN